MRMTLLLKAKCAFSAIPIKSPMAVFIEIENSLLKFIGEHKKPQIAKVSQKSNTGVITIPVFKLYYRAIVIKTMCYRHKNRHEEQCDRIEDHIFFIHSTIDGHLD
jgi:hypothetical protein